MFKKATLAAAALATAASALVPAAASAQYYGRGYDNSSYQQYDRYGRPVQYRDNGRRYYQDRNYRDVKRCSDGTTGTIVGAIAGGLLGRTIDTRGDRTLGTVLGGVGGALAGRAIERDGSKNAAYEGRCYR